MPPGLSPNKSWLQRVQNDKCRKQEIIFKENVTCSIVIRTSVLADELSLSCTRLMDGRLTTLWVKCKLSVNQQGQLSLPSLRDQLNGLQLNTADWGCLSGRCVSLCLQAARGGRAAGGSS